MSQENQSPTPIAVTMVLGAILSIQIGSAIATDLFPDIGAAGVVFLRAFVSSIFLFLIWRPSLKVPKEHRKVVLLFGVVLAGMNLCFYESIDRIPLGTAVTIEFIGPLGVAILTSRRRRDWLWAGLAGLGIVLLTGGIGGDLDVVGLVLAFVAGLFWGSYILLGKRIGEQDSGGKALVVPMIISTILVAPLGIADGGSALLDPKVIGVGIAIGVLSSAIPFSLELEAMRRLPSSVFGVMMSLEPAAAATVGFIILSQGMELSEVLAIALVVVASAGALRSAATPITNEP